MTYDMPNVSQLAMYIFSMHVIGGTSHSSNHWKLDIEEGKIRDADTEPNDADDRGSRETRDDSRDERDIVNLLWDKPVDFKYDAWNIQSDTSRVKESSEKSKDLTEQLTKPARIQNRIQSTIEVENRQKQHAVHDLLSCGDVVNTTIYDHLPGIRNRQLHPNVPEPDAAVVFQSGNKAIDIDIGDLERKLRKVKKTKPNTLSTYIKIGNFWRIKGNTQMSIECFRTVLSMSPNHPDVLLYLARLLYNLQYLDDAITLTRKSLEHQAPNKNSWLQHYTLGEILKAYGFFHEAAFHFHHALSLNPGFQPATGHLRDLDGSPPLTVTYYAAFVAAVLAVLVALGLLSTGEAGQDDTREVGRTPRHFNRAMAMRSLRQGHKLPRPRKVTN